MRGDLRIYRPKIALCPLLQVPGLAECIATTKRLNALLRHKSKKALDKVLEDAAETTLGSFVASLQRDLGAVQAALERPWTTRPLKANNRLEILKRSCRLRPTPCLHSIYHLTQRSARSRERFLALYNIA